MKLRRLAALLGVLASAGVLMLRRATFAVSVTPTFHEGNITVETRCRRIGVETPWSVRIWRLSQRRPTTVTIDFAAVGEPSRLVKGGDVVNSRRSP